MLWFLLEVAPWATRFWYEWRWGYVRIEIDIKNLPKNSFQVPRLIEKTYLRSP